MFGPNVKTDERGIYYHHREGMFHSILESLENVLANKFGLEEYEFVFLTGSGTTANETVIFSFRQRFTFLFTDADFGQRLVNISEAHNKRLPVVSQIAYPLYETSISRLNIVEDLGTTDALVFLDMVSAFPYYLPPKGTAIWTTVSGKQLGAYPVLGIIGIHKELDLGDYVINSHGSCLNLLSHLWYRKQHETNTTPAIPLYYDLLQQLLHFDRGALVKKINTRRKKIVHLIGIDNVMGVGPVVTFKPNDKLVPIAVDFNLYKSKAGFQVFLWSGTDGEYEAFYRALERIKI